MQLALLIDKLLVFADNEANSKFISVSLGLK